MNPFIERQLNLVRVANIPPTQGNKIVIPKRQEFKELELTLGHIYILKLADYIVKPPANFNLHIQWNNNNVPKYKYLQCCIVRDIGKMIKVDGVGIDNMTMTKQDYKWEGWLPKKSVNIIKELV